MDGAGPKIALDKRDKSKPANVFRVQREEMQARLPEEERAAAPRPGVRRHKEELSGTRSALISNCPSPNKGGR